MRTLNTRFHSIDAERLRHVRIIAALALVGLSLIVDIAHAQSCGSVVGFSGFTNLLGSVAGFLTGGFARAAVIIAIAILGALMAFGELKGIFGTGVKILFGASLLLGAAQWAALFSGFNSAASACSYITNGV